MGNSDANSCTHWVTHTLGTVATIVVGTKSVDALTQSVVMVTKAVVAKVAATTNIDIIS
ncbi:hypothetical protein MPH47_07355 [Psychrobacillus psychrodurans]|uniref:hypothetical protein n=1 Tax=Psychrobacillus psychrodurans TaxID=126157 RepID=UPI001F4E7BBD|nr:hypothetical protein [Psychrobacillus psychrodurans]MCK1997041.1 hypothetical protein [Psychrobacillus psychrodurans]